MSRYLSKYYCGNMENKCNYQEPINYTKIVDRQFMNKFSEKVDECNEIKGKKGYCCDPNDIELGKVLEDKYINNLNEKIGVNTFTNKERDRNIPLVKVKKNIEGKILEIDVCNCGGSENYDECVKERCNGYSNPTGYEFCKLGEYNKPLCETQEGPGISEDNSKNCKLKLLKEERINIKVDNLVKDCYKNLCEKKGKLDMLKNRYTTEDKYFKLGDSLINYGLNMQTKEIDNSLKDKSLRDYLLEYN